MKKEIPVNTFFQPAPFKNIFIKRGFSKSVGEIELRPLFARISSFLGEQEDYYTIWCTFNSDEVEHPTPGSVECDVSKITGVFLMPATNKKIVARGMDKSRSTGRCLENWQAHPIFYKITALPELES